MEEIGKTEAVSKQQLTLVSNSSNDKSSARTLEIARCAKILFGCYRTGEASDPVIYTRAVEAILSAYPIEIIHQVVDPVRGLASKVRWLPSPAEVKAACDELYGPILRAREWDNQAKRQIRERDGIEEIRSRPRQSYAEFKDEMAKRGMPMGGGKSATADIRPFRRYTDDKLRAMYPQKPAAT